MGIRSNKFYTPEISIIEETAPAEEPVTLAEQKNYSRIELDETIDDALINSLISAGRQQAESYVRGGFITRDYKQSEDASFYDNSVLNRLFLSSDFAIEIKNILVSAISEVAFYSEDNLKQIIDPSLYRLDRPNATQPARVVFTENSTLATNARYWTQYEIKYTAGWANAGAVPADIKLAIMATVAMWYENREEIKGITKQSKKNLHRYRILEVN